MGCGSSRVGGVAAARADEGGVVPISAGMRPLLRKRLEEMKKWNHASVLKGSQTLSKKELLRPGSSDYGEETDVSEGSLKSSAKVAPAPDHQIKENKEDVDDKISSRSDDCKEVKEDEEIVNKPEEESHDLEKEGSENGINHDDEPINYKKKGDDNVVNLDDDATIVKKEGDDDEGRMSNFDERMICPGSPSFKVYCVDDADDDEEKDGENTRKSMETNSVITKPKEDENIIKKERRERKGKRFGMGLPRKYLSNVTAPCYSSGGGCMRNNHSRLTQDKSNQ